MESSFSTRFSPTFFLLFLPFSSPLLLITTLQSPEKEREKKGREEDFLFLPSLPEFECGKRRKRKKKKSFPPPFFSFPSPPFSPLDRCLVKKGRKGKKERVKQTHRSPSFSFPSWKKTPTRKCFFFLLFSPIPSFWENGRRNTEEGMVGGKREREGKKKRKEGISH